MVITPHIIKQALDNWSQNICEVTSTIGKAKHLSTQKVLILRCLHYSRIDEKCMNQVWATQTLLIRDLDSEKGEIASLWLHFFRLTVLVMIRSDIAHACSHSTNSDIFVPDDKPVRAEAWVQRLQDSVISTVIKDALWGTVWVLVFFS